MDISPIGIQNIEKNNFLPTKNPSFKKFGGIDKEFYTKLNSDELEVLFEEAKSFANSKFCDIKYAKGPFDTYNVAVKLKNSPILKTEPMKTKHGVCGQEHQIDTNSIGWQIINTTSCPSYKPYNLEFSDYDCPECNHYILHDIDEETKEAYDKNEERIKGKFKKYPYLQHAYGLWCGLAFAYAYEAYWTRQESEAAAKVSLASKFGQLMG